MPKPFRFYIGIVAIGLIFSGHVVADILDYEGRNLPEFAKMLREAEEKKKQEQDAQASKSRQEQEKVILNAADLATAKAEAQKIIQEAAKTRAEIEGKNRALETAQEKLKRANRDLTRREAELSKTDRLMKTGIFGCAATCIVGIISCLAAAMNGRRDRHLTLLEILEKETALENAGVDLSSISGYSSIRRRITRANSPGATPGAMSEDLRGRDANDGDLGV